jgi:signal peptidase I
MQRFLRFVTWTVAVCAIVGALLRLVLFEPWTLPEGDAWLGASVAPTLAAGDTVLVLTRGTPEFSDLVRCRDPEDPNRWVVGRIVGLGGDTVSLTGGILQVNNRRYDSMDACDKRTIVVKHPASGQNIELDCGRADTGGGWHFRATSKTPNPRDDVKKEVGPGRVFVLSDNRLMHDDSRDFGTLPIESCKDRIVFRLWSSKGFADSANRFNVIR